MGKEGKHSKGTGKTTKEGKVLGTPWTSMPAWHDWRCKHCAKIAPDQQTAYNTCRCQYCAQITAGQQYELKECWWKRYHSMTHENPIAYLAKQKAYRYGLPDEKQEQQWVQRMLAKQKWATKGSTKNIEAIWQRMAPQLENNELSLMQKMKLSAGCFVLNFMILVASKSIYWHLADSTNSDCTDRCWIHRIFSWHLWIFVNPFWVSFLQKDVLSDTLDLCVVLLPNGSLW